MMGASYKSKKLLKESIGKPLNYVETSMFGPEYKSTGTFCVVGPSPYERKWLEVRQSGLPDSGEGVFALRDIPSGRCVGLYTGLMFNGEEEQSMFHKYCKDNTTR